MSYCRSCGKEIKWIRMKSGKMMPCDMPPHRFIEDKEGKYLFITQYGDTVRGVLDDRGIPDVSGHWGYISHFATCPYAEKHRKRG